jgi:DNA polymerase-3 subunit alpha
MSFVHLHTHTEYSMLDSTIRVGDLIQRAVDDGASAIAITDHNNLFGAVTFFKAATQAGIKPILGAEVNIVADDRTAKNIRRSGTIVLLCRNDEGYRNLCILLSRAYLDTPGQVPVPRIDRELLKEHCGGLLALTGSLSGEIPQELLAGRHDAARDLARFYTDLFDDGCFFLEIVRNGISEQDDVNKHLLTLSTELSLPLVATADAHYNTEEESAAHEVLMCIQLGKSLPSLSTRARLTDRLHLAPAAEMKARFADVDEAVQNTQVIADMCEVDLALGNVYLPNYQVPEEHTVESYLEQVARVGLQDRLDLINSMARYEADTAEYEARLAKELEIIVQMGFPGYFLIVWDFIDYARKQDIPVGPGRGSGAGSLVAYCLGITDIDPLHYGLLFERFLNPERVSMPDFDIDFCMNKRDRVIQYVAEKYGTNNVGQIITYGTMKAKAAVRDVSRVLGLSYAEADRAAKLIPDDLGMTLERAFEVEKRLTDLVGEDPRYERLFEVARVLEGLNRQPGIHAAGVVIADKPLWEYVPIYAVPVEGVESTLITQFAKNEVEEAGLVKFDFLGLKTLTVIDHAVKIINRGREAAGEGSLEMSRIELREKSVFDLMSGGNTTGVFQLESSGFKDLLRKLKPDCVEDVIAAVALYRPGPLQSGMVDSFIRRKHGEESVAYPHPALEETLAETYGVMVYQEQVMQAASVLAGFSLGQADILRRAMGKKKPEEMAKQRGLFCDGATKRGVDANQAGEIFDTIEKFAGYGFNKSHSAAYGMISYQTAWLKTMYPVEFMAALLTCDGDNTDKVVRFIAEARSLDITVLPPSVNQSELDFAVADGAIRFGLGAIKGVGTGAVEAIIAAREESGLFDSLFDFCERVDLRRCNKRVMEALVKCGAFDDFDATRASIFTAIESAVERGGRLQQDRLVGQTNLFGALETTPTGETKKRPYPDVEEWPEKLCLSYEKECLGFYVSGHPLDRYVYDIQRIRCTPLANIPSCAHRTSITVAGVVTAVRERTTREGKSRMAFVSIEDLTGRAEVVVFSKLYETAEALIKGDEPLILQAMASHEGDGEAKSVRLRGESVTTLREMRAQQSKRVTITLESSDPVDGFYDRLEAYLTDWTQGFPVEVILKVEGYGEVLLELGSKYRLEADDSAVERVERLVGKGSVVFH